jgi:hypothetical protein
MPLASRITRSTSTSIPVPLANSGATEPPMVCTDRLPIRLLLNESPCRSAHQRPRSATDELFQDMVTRLSCESHQVTPHCQPCAGATGYAKAISTPVSSASQRAVTHIA